MFIIAPLLLLAGLYLFQDRLILQPDFVLDSWKNAVAGDAVRWEEEGRYLGKIHEPPGPKPAQGTVILFHGNAGTVDHRGVLARALTAYGLRTVLLEYPGFGERAGTAGVEESLTASLEGFALAARRWPAPLYVVGESFGAGMAAQVVRAYPDRVKGALLITPWDSLASLADEKALHLPVRFLLRHPLDSAQALADYRGNVAILGAARDSVIPVAHARALAAALPHAFYLEAPQAGHNNWLAHLSPADWQRLLDAMRN